ncbi:DegT/DnrJ/EryC1/StrS family aminotransferase [Lactococcus lactis]|uniref:DegT/DnrJ/EryC1/StrS family aminotransferase n=1 Tax=Lactococcus lactis subsp. lactis TaxID=1360 RepID=A0AAJ4MKH4_LACLL|nr:DegT/DnrJ/EryC1/StrS family aminotransferase [Lactococcus lactis]QRZ33794.1 DegT/DnrJ/EryC1/StrS family aminotransferase [Lactococcus lactis subsp. lactis]
MSNPILVTRSSMPSLNEYVDEIKDIFDSHWMTNMGVKHQELEKKLKELLEVEGVQLMVNGHMALELGIQAMNLTGEVITTPYTFASTTHAIVRNGLEPVFCDIDPKTYTMDVSKIEELITDRTSAIMPVHVYGNICNIEEIERIARKYSLKVIYDAAHTFGETYKGKSIAQFGDASMFSFHATKAFNTIEGGAVAYHNSEYGLDLARLKNFGIRNEELVDYVGSNAKMNEFSAAMGLCNLRHLDEEIEKRHKVYDAYRSGLAGVEGLHIFEVQKDVTSNYAYFPIVVDENVYGHTRNELKNILEEHGIFSRKYFYPLTSAFDCYHGKYDVNKTPIALHYSKRVLALPMYSDLALEDVSKICNIIIEFAN